MFPLIKKVNEDHDAIEIVPKRGDVLRDPFKGIGTPEPLKYHFPAAWSRRIDDEHRLVYIVGNDEIIILATRYRY